MFNTITTIAALSTFAACSTPFEASGDELQKPALSETASSADLEGLSIDGQAGLELANVGGPVFDEVAFETPSLFAPDLVDTQERMVSVVDTPDAGHELAALLAKRVDGMLNIRMYPAANTVAEVCIQGNFGEACFRGLTQMFDRDQGGEFLIELDRYDLARTYTIEILSDDISGEVFGPFDMPGDDNIWKEVLGCDSELKVEAFDYQIYQGGNNRIGFVSYYSLTPTSVLMCGIDEAGDKGCVWDSISEGNKRLKIRLDPDQRNPDVLLRDAKGCSVSYGPTE